MRQQVFSINLTRGCLDEQYKTVQVKKQQKEWMRIRDIYEQLQTEHSEDECFYRYMQNRMDDLDEQAGHIRGVLEGRWRE